MSRSEAKTRKELIDPKLREAGWFDHDWQIDPEYRINAGRIIGRGTRTYEHLDKDKEKLGFFILEHANYATQLFNDPDWDDEPEDFIQDDPVIIDDRELGKEPK